MPIQILPPEVASQIAAGEVIERPASVVKELVENALDAGASVISIEIGGAGRSLVRVTDNGSGIPLEELPLAVERHATSKLRTASDLFHITTLGFRGEALASIGSVSRMTLTSRAAVSPIGGRIRVEGGKIGSVEVVGAPVGTSVQVEDLFFNVPARLKFLKQDLTERRAIDILLARYALAYPHVRFKLSEGKTIVLQTAGDGDRRAILAALYGVETAQQMLEVIAEEDQYHLTGFLSPVALTRSNRKEIAFFVNGRWVQDVPLTTALLQAYHTLLMVGRYPLATLFLELPAEEVDVNVHPAKAEVRFRNPDRVFSFVQRAARRTLLAYTPIPQASPQQLWKSEIKLEPKESPRQIDLAWTVGHGTTAGQGQPEIAAGPASKTGTSASGPYANTTVSSESGRIPLLRLIGQVGAAYLVAEGPDGLYLIDQHAAHERVLFEKLMSQYAQKDLPAQALLTPVVVTLPPHSARTLEAHLPFLNAFGFQVEPFGPNTFQVRAVPTLFAAANPVEALYALVDDFEEDETPLQTEVEVRLAARVCKRLAIKAGQTLSPEEQRTLLNDLELCASPRTCPHGRPTMIHLSVEMLERQFGRRGAR
ncbi:MAG: DNA mismatch repair endonuclease MutL [Anaerolineales bacterium]|nr:DNA mismatch repair endonuclease MutL [Anaerolineales bacterium]MDW8228147.1 DNA mismatch repair endonuclease MutL [Anaerolineales bacterium]